MIFHAKALVTGARNRFNNNSPLHLATEGGHIEAVKIMLENGVCVLKCFFFNDTWNEIDQAIPQVSPTDENIDGFTPVHLAAKVLKEGLKL